MDNERVSPDDLCIERDASTDWVELYCSEGEYLGHLPASMSDSQIRSAVFLANQWHSVGYVRGGRIAKLNIQQALGIK